MRMFTVLIVLATASTSLAQEAPWSGTWTYDQGERDVARSVDVDEASGRASMSLDVPGYGRVLLEGEILSGSDLRLEATVKIRVGLIGRLQGEDHGAEVKIVLEASKAYHETKTENVTQATASVFVDEERALSETWRRAGKSSLELVSVSPSTFDPSKEKPVTIAFRLKGDPHRVEFSIRAPKDSRRSRFYRGQLTSKVVASGFFQGDDKPSSTALGVKAQPGVHRFTWDGRDASKAQRFLLGGSYTLELRAYPNVPGLKAIEARPKTITFAKPLMTLFSPYDNNQPTAGFPKLQAAPALRSGFRMRTKIGKEVDDLSVLDLGHSLATSAVVSVAAHGDTGAILVPTAKKGWPSGVSAPLLRKANYRDAHTVFIYGCNVGTPHPEEGDLVGALLAAGVDVVVSFKELIPAEADINQVYHQRLALQLMKRGVSVRAAAEEAAAAGDKQMGIGRWLAYTPLKKQISVRGKTWETLSPARYGNYAD